MPLSRLLACSLLLLALAACGTTDPRLARGGDYIGRAGEGSAGALQRKGAPPGIMFPTGMATAWQARRASKSISMHSAPTSIKVDNLVGVSVVSSGREGYGTPPGKFKIVQKDISHASNLYGDYVDAAGNVVKKDVDVRKDPKPPGAIFRGAPMPYFVRIHGGVGLHAGFLPGYAASHGCIRAPEHMAATFFDNVQVGTPVEVIN